ncbi:sulfatase-like hydrolase/transferase [Thalassotalea crassostreae]|uniref:sulfatase-like hydrolase/transferase n=1 Tax=Thalassotalea crassostreae TaxID=1763536 RepID=UPI0009EE32A6|nr:sulfatase-like hydrolase/transferase [Thalassotalea crassostreae]
MNINKCFKSLLTMVTVVTSTAAFASDKAISTADENRPNIILMMADDLGYGDTGFTGHKVVQTPNLDQIAKDGAIMTNFHAGGPVCSPTRGTYLTGRHYFRYGIFSANIGHLPKQEITIAEVLKEKGYTTGHFGKWHLGTLSKTESSKGAKRKPAENYSPASWHGYDQSFVVESSIATYINPNSKTKGKKKGKNPFYINGVAVDMDDAQYKGGAGRIVMDQALPFMESAVANKQPFFTVIWFNAPHAPVEASPELHKFYTDKGVKDGVAHYYGSITEMDQQIGRLRSELERLGVADNTLIAFTSDNGPEGKASSAETDKVKKGKERYAGVTDGLRGRKRSLYEGGVRVPTVVMWPGKIKPSTIMPQQSSTLDYLPTMADLVNYNMPDERPIDGVSLLPLLSGQDTNFKRSKPIPFRHRNSATLIDGDYKLVMSVGKKSDNAELYNMSDDRAETTDIIAKHPERASAMIKQLKQFLKSAEKSHSGADYSDPNYKPVDSWPTK